MHIPERMCIACRQMKKKSELIRIVKRDDTAILDISQKLGGRGAYIRNSKDCIVAARKRRALSKHFKMAVSDEIYDAAQEMILSE